MVKRRKHGGFAAAGALPNDPVNGSDPSGQDACDGSNPTACPDGPVTGTLGSDCNIGGICSGGTLTFGNLTSSASWVNTDISVGDFWQYNGSYGGYVNDATSITACNSFVCGSFPTTSSGANSASDSSRSSQGGASLTADLANIIQNQQNWQNMFVAAYSMSGYLGLALGMHNPIGGFEDGVEAAGSSAVTPFVFRGVQTSPESIFAEGFSPKGSSMDLLAHALDSGSPPSGYVSTSTSAEVASIFGSNIAVIKTPANAINVNAVLGSASPFPTELEMAVPGSIAGSQVRAVTITSQGVSILNPGFKP